MKKILIISVIAFIGFGCAHHRDVRPGVDGVHNVIIKTDDTDKGSRNALKQANHFCEERGLGAAIVNEEQKYTGTMKEETYNNAKTAAKVATAVGGAVYVFGGKNESALGGITGLGGGIADQVLGDGYMVQMKLKCL